MKKCPICDEDKIVKNGFVNSNQRFFCKNCNYNFTKSRKKTSSDIDKNLIKYAKRLAMHMRIDGMSYREIASKIGVSHSTIEKWTRKYCNEIKKSSFIGKKRDFLIASDVPSLELIDFIKKHENLGTNFYLLCYP